MRFELIFKMVLKELNADGTSNEIVGIERTESFEGKPKNFKSHFEMVGYEVDCRLEKEFDKQFPTKLEEPLTAPPLAIVDDEIPF